MLWRTYHLYTRTMKRFIHLTTRQNTVQKCNILLCILLICICGSLLLLPILLRYLHVFFVTSRVISRARTINIIFLNHHHDTATARRCASPLTCSVHSALHSRCVGASTTCTAFSVNAYTNEWVDREHRHVRTNELLARAHCIKGIIHKYSAFAWWRLCRFHAWWIS